MYLIESKSKHAREEDPGERIKEMLCDLKELVDDILEEAEAMEDLDDDQDWPEAGRAAAKPIPADIDPELPVSRRAAVRDYAPLDTAKRMAREPRRMGRYGQRRVGY